MKGNFPADALERWHKLPLTAEEFYAIETNVAPVHPACTSPTVSVTVPTGTTK